MCASIAFDCWPLGASRSGVCVVCTLENRPLPGSKKRHIFCFSAVHFHQQFFFNIFKMTKMLDFESNRKMFQVGLDENFIKLPVACSVT